MASKRSVLLWVAVMLGVWLCPRSALAEQTENFETGSLGGGWPAQWTAVDGGASVTTATASFSSSGHLGQIGGATGTSAMRYLAEPGPSVDSEQLVDVAIGPGTGISYVTLLARYTSPNSRYGVLVGQVSSSAAARFYRVVGGHYYALPPTAPATPAFGVSIIANVNSWYHWRFKVTQVSSTSTLLQTKLWQGAVEPTGWTLEVQDSEPTLRSVAGYDGLGGTMGIHANMYFDNYSLTTGSCPGGCQASQACTADADCASGLTCAIGQAPRFGGERGKNVCMRPDCFPDPSLLGCGVPGAVCGQNCENAVRCDLAAPSCGSNEACVDGLSIGSPPRSTPICAPPICNTAPAQNCGTPSSTCGDCRCAPNCAGKQCGGDLSDGCGGQCPNVCADGQQCTSTAQCMASSVCGRGIGPRFGLPSGTDACWPGACADGKVGPECPGNAAPQCSGEFCGECGAGLFRSGGSCLPTVLTLRPDGSHFPDPIVPAPTDAVGATPASFDVSDRGTADYTIPIEVPPGRLGLQPQLALAYSSTKKDGMVGIGWNLTGLPSIARCRRILDRDGTTSPITFDQRDRFCLDGQALIQVPHNPPESYGAAGAEYRTEIDTFTKVVAFGGSDVQTSYSGPLYFKAWTKDGRILTFGDSDDSSVFVAARTKRIWAVSRIEDRANNLIHIQYESHKTVGSGRHGYLTNTVVEDTGELLPKTIGYGGKTLGNNGLFIPPNVASRFVRFTYEDRPDALHHYVSGVQGFSQSRLKSVDTYVEASLVKSYHLAYQPPQVSQPNQPIASDSKQLQSVTECAPDAATGVEVCKKPTLLDYYAEDPPDNDSLGKPTPGSGNEEFGVVVLDSDGDGADEFLTADHLDPNCGPNGTSCHPLFEWHLTRASPDSSGQLSFSSTDGNLDVPTALDEWPPCISQESVVDLDGDGGDDLAFRCGGSGGPTDGLIWYKVAATGLIEQNKIPLTNFVGSAQFGDLNGDGLKDIVWCNAPSWQGGQHQVSFALNTSSPGTQPTFGATQIAGTFTGLCPQIQLLDIDGDGDDDIIHPATADGRFIVYSPDAAGFITVAPALEYLGHADELRALDFNGDGLKDFVTVPTWYGGNSLRFYANTGVGFEEQTVPLDVTVDMRRVIVEDVDGNGADDIVTATGWISLVRTGVSSWHPTRAFFEPYVQGVYSKGAFADLDGDGDPEYVYQSGHKYLPSFGSTRARQLRTVTDGVGKQHSIDYDGWSSYADRDNPTPLRRRTYGDARACFQAAGQTTCARRMGGLVSAVRETQLSNIDGATFENPGPERHYKYGNFRVGLKGRGALGFQARTTTLGTLTTTHESYSNLDYRLAGHLESSSTTTGDIGFAGTPFGDVAAVCRLSVSIWQVRPGAVAGTSFAFLKTHNDFEGHPAQDLCEWVTNRAISVDPQDVDDYGGIRKQTNVIEKIGPDGETFVTRVATTPRINKPDWIIGLIDFATIEETRNGEHRVKKTNYEYDDLGLIHIVEREPDDPTASTYQRTTIDRNSYGVPTRTCVQDSDLAETERCTEVLDFDDYMLFPKHVSNAVGLVTEINFSPNDGKLLTAKDPNNLLSEFSYDAFGRRQAVRTPTSSGTYSYFAAWMTDSEFDNLDVWGALGVRADFVGVGESVTIVDADGRTVSTSRSGFGTPVNTERAYDQLGRLSMESLPHEPEDVTQGTNQYHYNTLGRLDTIIGPTGLQSRFAQIDFLIASSSAASWFNQTDGAWAQVEQLPRGNVRVRVEDAFGAPARVVEAANENGDDQVVTDFRRGAFGYLERASAPGGDTVYHPDDLGRNFEVEDPNLGTRTFTHDGFDQIATATDANQVVLTFTYDALGRQLETLDASSNVLASFAYDGDGPNELGRLVSTTRQALPGSPLVNATRMHYDSPSGLPSSVDHRVDATAADPDTTGTLYTMGYSYGINNGTEDVPWALKQLTYPDVGGGSFAVEFGYDESGNLESVHKPNAPNDIYWKMTAADQGFRLAEEQFGNGAVSSREYYSRSSQTAACTNGEASCIPGALHTIQTQGDGATVQDMTYGYDLNGNVSALAPAGSAPILYTYDYDGLDRLIHEALHNSAGTFDTDYVYNQAGDIEYRSDVGTYDYSDHQFAAGSSTYKLDSNGNQWERSGSLVAGGYQHLYYNEFDKPWQVTTGTGVDATTTRLEYEASGARVGKREMLSVGEKKTTTIDELYERTTAPGTAAQNRYRITAGSRVIAEITRGDTGSTHVAYLHDDRLGSPTTVTDENGDAILSQRYLAFGTTVNAVDDTVRAGFSGHTNDVDLGLVNMRGRLYDPKIGRFLTADPFVFHPLGSQGWNRYAYVENNPLGATDPTGFEDHPDADVPYQGESARGPMHITMVAPPSTPTRPATATPSNGGRSSGSQGSAPQGAASPSHGNAPNSSMSQNANGAQDAVAGGEAEKQAAAANATYDPGGGVAKPNVPGFTPPPTTGGSPYQGSGGGFDFGHWITHTDNPLVSWLQDDSILKTAEYSAAAVGVAAATVAGGGALLGAGAEAGAGVAGAGEATQTGGVVLFHGTDAASAAEIVEGGLDAGKAAELGGGDAFWSTTDQSVARVFSLANPSGGPAAIVQMSVPQAVIASLQRAGLVAIEGGVHAFSSPAFAMLNEFATFGILP